MTDPLRGYSANGSPPRLRWYFIMPEMSLELILFLLGVGSFTLAAAVCDFRTRRIPNKLTLPMLIAGLVYQGVFGGWSGGEGLATSGLASALQTFGVAFGLLFVLWMVGGGGGGDVKLVGALSVWLGFRLTLLVLVASTVFVLLGTLAILGWSMVSRGAGGTRSKYIASGKPSSVADPASNTVPERAGRRIMAYAMPVAAATWVIAILKFPQL